MEQQSIDLGKVALTLGGNWNAQTSYERLTLVLLEEDGCGYISLRNNINVKPGTDATVWQKASKAGSSIYELCVKQGTFIGTEAEFVAQYNNAVAAATSAAGLANAAAQTANTAASNADTKAGLANTAAQTANTAASNADTKAALAESEADRAKGFADHPNRINTTTYHWEKWDEDEEDYVDTGIMATASPYAGFEVNQATGQLVCTTDEYYGGPTFSLDAASGQLQITV